jgi:hypothetical protein
MNRRTSTRSSLEILEDRCCPSAMAWMSNGSLMVHDSTSANLAITEVGAGTFRVVDNNNVVGTYHVTNDIDVTLAGQTNTVDFYLQGYAAPGSVSVDAHASESNDMAILNGIIRGNLTIRGGQGTDNVVLGGPSGPLQVDGNAFVQLNKGPSDTLQVNSGVTIEGNLTANSANYLTLAAGSTVDGSAIIGDGPAGDTVTLDGTVGRLAKFIGSMQYSDHVTVGQTAKLGSLVVQFGDGDSTLTMDGKVLDEFYLQKGIGSDTITLAGTIGGYARLDLSGDSNTHDTVTITGTIGGSSAASPTGDALLILRAHNGLDAGSDTVNLAAHINGNVLVNTNDGNSAVTFENGLDIEGSAKVNFGAGNDVFALGKGAQFRSADINGGGGTNTFDGNIHRVTAHHFQIVNP